jgi:RNA polymerase sigma-70 factor, ECF subfamily
MPLDVLELFDEHHAGLFRFAYRMTGSKADAEDIVQECFLTLLRPGCAFDPARTPVRSYLFGVIRNQALKRRARASGEIAQSRMEPSPESQTVQTELEEAVARAVVRLPEGQREALILAHYEQLPVAEIASVMEIEVTAVKSRLQRARANLKEMLAAYSPDKERRR